MTAPALTCFHCGAAVPTGTVLAETCGTAEIFFCCRGCHGAYLLISDAGLSEFYRRRTWEESTVSAESSQRSYNDTYLDRFIQQEGEWSAIDLIIDGIRCASCVWLNEKMIDAVEGVQQTRVNYATNRARVLFDPHRVKASAILERIAAIGYAARPYTPSAAEESARREQKDLAIRFGTAFFLTMQLMAYAFALYAGYLQGIGAGMKHALQLFSLLVTTPVVFYSGWPFLTGAWRGLVNRTPNMELLIALGSLSSYFYSIYAMLAGGEVYFETAAMIVTLILAGRLLENAAKKRAAGGIERLLRLTAGEASRFKGEELETVDISVLGTGDVILVTAGERFPVDGHILEGTSDIDESPATGEALPVLKGAGDPVIAGSTNLTGAVRVRCDRPATESFIARVAALVEEAQSRRPPIQGVADRAAAWFVPVVLLLALGTFLCYLGAGTGTAAALMNALSVLVIACPCALGLATPTAILAGSGAAAANGIIFKGGDVLERLSRVSVAAFDKTGTLTCGRPALVEVRAVPGTEPDQAVALAAGVECGSRHPVGKAICDYAQSRGLAYPVGQDLAETAGAGVTARVGNQVVAVGTPAFLKELGVHDVPEEIDTPEGIGAVCVARSGSYLATILFRDRVRDAAPALVSYFSGKGIRSVILSGDRKESARQMATQLGMVQGLGEMSPSRKGAHLEELRAKGECVLMVGDGINDAPALSAADVGCALAGGTDIAIETSDLVLAKADLKRLETAHGLAQQTMQIVKQNLVWAFVYNMIGIPLAMAGRLTPIYAAAAMALSSTCVVGNSLRIRGKRHG